MQGLKISVTARSQNLWQEYSRLMWDRDRNGVWLQRPENGNDHAIDGCRYFLQRHLKKNVNDTKEFYDKIKMKQFGYKFASAPRNKPRAGLR
jgi:phage terminase large subunit